MKVTRLIRRERGTDRYRGALDSSFEGILNKNERAGQRRDRGGRARMKSCRIINQERQRARARERERRT